MTYAPGLLVLGPGEGRQVSALGNIAHNKVESQHTDGRWALAEIEQPMTGGNPPLHLHEREDEAFYVLQGRLRVQVGTEEFEGEAGTFVLAPRGVPHAYARLSDVNLRLLVFVSPAGFEHMFDDIARLPVDQQRDPAVLGQVGANYGIQILGPPLM